jgi:hypothetical protein
VRPIFPGLLLLVDELEIGFVYQRGRLQRRVALPPSPLLVGALPELGVNLIVEIAAGLPLSLLKAVEQLRDGVAGWVVHW